MTTTVLLGAIAPHSDLAIAEACSPETRDVTPQTQRAMDGFGRRVAGHWALHGLMRLMHAIPVAGGNRSDTA